MKEEGQKYVIAGGIDPAEFVEVSAYMISRQKGTGKRLWTRKQPPDIPFAPVITTLYGVTIKPLKDLGQHGKPDAQSFWREILGTLKLGHGFQVPKSKLRAAPDAVRRYTKDSQKVWKQKRKFIFEKNVDEEGNPSPGNGRIGRIL